MTANTGADGSTAPPPLPLGTEVLFARAPQAIVAFDHTGRIDVANASACALARRNEATLTGSTLVDLVHPPERVAECFPLDDDTHTIEASLVLPDGGRQSVRLRVLRDAGRWVAFIDDQNDHLQQMVAAENSADARYGTLLQNIDDVVALCDQHGSVMTILGQFERLLGWPLAHFHNRTVFDLVHPDERAEVTAAFEQLLRMHGVPVVREFRLRDHAGHWAWTQFTATNLIDDPTVRAVVLVARNVTDRRRAESLQATQAAIYELIACAAPMDLIFGRLVELVETHVHGSVVGFLLLENATLTSVGGSRLPLAYVEAISGPRTKWFGTTAEAINTGANAVVADVATNPLYDGHRDTLAGARATMAIPIDDDLSEFGPCGVLAIHLHQARLINPDEEMVTLAAARLAAIALQRHRTQRQLAHLAHHDHLTGLPNRSQLQAHLDTAIARSRAHNSALAVMFLDVDNFKIVNDSLGHSAGDHVLVGFADRLAAMLRPDDAVGRFGGDEFVVVLENIASVEDAVLVAERLLDDLQHPLRIGDQSVFLSVSVGIAVSVGGNDTADVLLRNADSAMYQAKARGRARVEVFDDSHPARSAKRLRLEGDLHRAFEQQQFVLHWQPKIALDTGRIVSAEALVRWNHPERGLIQPTEFIRVTEETELIVRIGGWVLEEAIRQRAEWETEHGDEAPWSIAVNVSALQLVAPRALEQAVSVLRRFDWAPERLVFELTESVLMSEGGGTSPILHNLKELGVQIAIDDFGTGYSSLSYLHRYPVDQVKLDRSFVSGIGENGEGSAIAKAVIHMAHALGITVTAEGVETDAQHRGLRALRCDRAQGFWFSPPLPAEEFSALLRTKPRYA